MSHRFADPMRFPTLRNPIRFLLGLMAGSICFGDARGAALYGIVADGDPLASKRITGLTFVHEDGAVGSISSSLAGSDPAAAAAWISSLPENTNRDGIIESYIFSESLGNVDTRYEALRQIAGAWLSHSGDGELSREIVAGDRSRESGGGRRDRIETTEWRPICSCVYGTPIIISLPVIPEPSSSLLAGLGGLALLRRRRAAPAARS